MAFISDMKDGTDKTAQDELLAWRASVRAAFAPMQHPCFDAARWHPLPLQAVAAQQAYLLARARNACWQEDPGADAQEAARAGFARLIGSRPDDIALVPSTGWAEQLVVGALSLSDEDAILTDTAHFDASVLHYDMLARAGRDIRYVTAGPDGVDLDDVAARLSEGGVRLIATSLVSNTTGFTIDLPALVALAHRYDALVYVDIIQAAGAIPINVLESGVDFCATAGYKWLMGDMGLGFLYVAPAALPLLRRPVYGFRQMREFIEPWPAQGIRNWSLRGDAEGLFGVNSRAAGVAASIAASLDLIDAWTVSTIHAHRAAQLERIGSALTSVGYPQITPAGSAAPFLVFDTGNRPHTAQRLRSAGIDAGISASRLRIAPALHVESEDVDRLINALAA